MATIFTHALLPIAARVATGPGHFSGRLLVVAMLATILPDADVIAFAFGVPYADPLGHRGFTHSLTFAVFMGAIAAAFAQRLNSTRMISFITLFLATASHPFLDSFTNGGLGVAWFWPIVDTRYFMPWQPIEVSPIGASNFFSARGAVVLLSEARWIVAPIAIIAVSFRFLRSRQS